MTNNCVCLVCGKKFYTKASRLAKGFGKYCSNACRHIGTRGQRKPNNRVCIVCGKEFRTKPSYIKEGKMACCSKGCRDKAMSGEGPYSPSKGPIRRKYMQYRQGAKARGLVFDLPEHYFKTFWQKPCFYCGSPIDTIGLDRIENSVGYTVANVVACCETCNKMKLNLDHNDFLLHVEKIVNCFGSPKVES